MNWSNKTFKWHQYPIDSWVEFDVGEVIDPDKKRSIQKVEHTTKRPKPVEDDLQLNVTELNNTIPGISDDSECGASGSNQQSSQASYAEPACDSKDYLIGDLNSKNQCGFNYLTSSAEILNSFETTTPITMHHNRVPEMPYSDNHKLHEISTTVIQHSSQLSYTTYGAQSTNLANNQFEMMIDFLHQLQSTTNEKLEKLLFRIDCLEKILTNSLPSSATGHLKKHIDFFTVQVNPFLGKLPLGS
ncbi:uncharacterized protein LOC123477459 [Daphnia magna]|uniref:uncharacterized protein LOC123477459 n=1 Tax=Daphnia magna TaxID=35525 RepID=UPI001E1BAC1E|nr:uncharacterized protein LOC123477459 [Daphnia magna]